MHNATKAVLAILLSASMAFAGLKAPFVSFDITASTSSTVSDYWSPGGMIRVVLDDDDQGVDLRISKEYLRDSDFEDLSSGEATRGSLDVWDDDGALQGPWSMTEAIGGSVEVTSTELYGNESLLFDASGGTAVAELGSNMDLDVYAGGFTGWTENVNGGTGTITEGTTSEHTAGGSEAILTGGTAHVDFSQSFTVTASTEYFLTAWMREGDASDLCDIRIQESTGGTDFLQADGTWDAGEVDIATSSGTSYAQSVITFTTDTGITGVDVIFAADVDGDVCGIDDVSMALVPTTEILQTAEYQIDNTTADSYVLSFSHQDGGTDSVLQYQIKDISAGTVAGDTPVYYTGSAWSATETWLSAANAGTTTTETEADFEANSEGHRVQIKFRALMGTSEDITLDNVSLAENAVGTDLLLPEVNVVPEYIELPQGRWRVAVLGAGAVGVRVSGQFVGGE